MAGSSAGAREHAERLQQCAETFERSNKNTRAVRQFETCEANAATIKPQETPKKTPLFPLTIGTGF